MKKKPEIVGNYKRIGIFSVEEVLDFVPKIGAGSMQKEYLGKLVGMNSHRYYCFKYSGTKCVCCDLEGTYFALEKQKNAISDKYHFNLYGKDKNGKETMLTKDHRVAKSRGGKNHPDNYQTLCEPCNKDKAHGRYIKVYKAKHCFKIHIDDKMYDVQNYDNILDVNWIITLLEDLGHFVKVDEEWDGN